MSRLRDECVANQKGDLFDQSGGFYPVRKAKPLMLKSLLHLNMSEGAIKVAVHRLRTALR